MISGGLPRDGTPTARCFLRLLALVALWWAGANLLTAQGSDVVVERDPKTGKIIMRSKTKDAVAAGEARVAPEASTAAHTRPAHLPAPSTAAPSAEPPKASGPRPSAFARTPLPHQLPAAPVTFMALGLIVMVASGLWNLVVWWKAGVLWFLGGILIPFVWLIFLFVHWEEGRAPFLVGLAGLVVVVLSYGAGVAMMAS